MDSTVNTTDELLGWRETGEEWHMSGYWQGSVRETTGFSRDATEGKYCW